MVYIHVYKNISNAALTFKLFLLYCARDVTRMLQLASLWSAIIFLPFPGELLFFVYFHACIKLGDRVVWYV